jgi:hypothetical protein
MLFYRRRYVYKLERDWAAWPPPKDAVLVEACLKLVADNAAARGPLEEELLTEKTGPSGRFASAAETAQFESTLLRRVREDPERVGAKWRRQDL